MSWPFTARDLGDPGQPLIPMRTPFNGVGFSGRRTDAYRASVLWACLVLRADLVSTMPASVVRQLPGSSVSVNVAPPPFLIQPGISKEGRPIRWVEWLWGSQWDLDSCGNTFGLIMARDAAGRPQLIMPMPADEVTVSVKNGQLRYNWRSNSYTMDQVWHERAYPVLGSPVGLSPIAAAAFTIGNYINAAEFAAQWFRNKAVPGGHLKNTAKTLKRREAIRAKQSFKASVSGGDVWVSGSDWEYSPVAAKASDSSFLESIDASYADICRFIGVPGDMVDVPAKGSSVTYANITQRNLQFLITKLGPAITRREAAFSADLVSAPRQVVLDPGALLRLDPETLATVLKLQTDARHIVPSEARALYYNRPAYTEEQFLEFDRLFTQKRETITDAVGGTSGAAAAAEAEGI